MTNWFKKKFQQLSNMLNGNDDFVDSGEGAPPHEAPLENIEELKEIAMGAIVNSIKMLGHSNVKISSIIFHSAFADNAIENISLQALIQDAEFTNHLKRAFKARGIQYAEDLHIKLIAQSAHVNQVTKITKGLGVEVLTPTEVMKHIKARIVATEGITWEPEYILEPTGKTYLIGRCKDPKIENGPKIHNDIAFIGIEEVDEEKYKINSYVSRSHASITFDQEEGAYKLYRSRFLNNPSHKIKVYNSSLNDFSGVSVNHPAVPHVLRDGDSICFNDKVVLEFHLINQ